MDIKSFGERVINNLEKVIVGKRDALELIVVGLLCQGHILIEDVPGVGKTMMARSLARSLACTFSRIQFTPDMLPSDVTGVSIYNQQKKNSNFGPARSLVRSFLQMRSIAPRRRRKPLCSKRWKNIRLRWMA